MELHITTLSVDPESGPWLLPVGQWRVELVEDDHTVTGLYTTGRHAHWSMVARGLDCALVYSVTDWYSYNEGRWGVATVFGDQLLIEPRRATWVRFLRESVASPVVEEHVTSGEGAAIVIRASA